MIFASLSYFFFCGGEYFSFFNVNKVFTSFYFIYILRISHPLLRLCFKAVISNMCGLPQEEISGNVSDSVFITFRAGDCYWHLVDRGQAAALHVTMHRAALLNKELFCPKCQ